MSNIAQKVNTLAIQVKSLLKNAGVVVIDSLTSTSTTAAAAANSVSTLKGLVDNKLDASAYNDRYKGTYTSLASLQTAQPIANAGDTATVDTGAGAHAQQYLWDVQDGWVAGGSISPSNTDALGEGNAHLYFTNQRAKDAVLPEMKYQKVPQSTSLTLQASDLTEQGKKYFVFTHSDVAALDVDISLFSNNDDGKSITVFMDGTGALTITGDVIGNGTFTKIGEGKVLIKEGAVVRIVGAQ